MAEPVDIDGIPVELSAAQQRKWDSGDEAKREQVREKIRGYREKDGPQYDPLPDDEIAGAVGARHFKDD